MSALHPTFWRNTWLITRFELSRLFATPRGWVALAAFAVIWFCLLRYPIYEAAAQLQQPEIQAGLSQFVGMVGLYNLMRWPLPELIIYWLICLVLLPLAVVLTSADQTCGDRARGTLRFLTLRTSRDTLFFGRFFGQLLVQLLLISLSVVATLLLAMWRLQTLPLAAIEAALIMILNLLVVVMPVTALMALCSTLVRSSRLAIGLAIVGGGVLVGLIGWVGWYFPDVLQLLAYLPGAQIPQLLASYGWSSLSHAGLPLAQTLLLLAAGRLVMQGKTL